MIAFTSVECARPKKCPASWVMTASRRNSPEAGMPSAIKRVVRGVELHVGVENFACIPVEFEAGEPDGVVRVARVGPRVVTKNDDILVGLGLVVLDGRASNGSKIG